MPLASPRHLPKSSPSPRSRPSSATSRPRSAQAWQLGPSSPAVSPAGADARPWVSFAAWFSPATLALLWSERYGEVRPLLDESIAQARATGDSSRLAMALANRAWLALRRGDPSAAEADARTALDAIELPAPPAYRVLELRVARRLVRAPGPSRRCRAGARAARLRGRGRIARRGSASLRPRPAPHRPGTSRRRGR